MAVNNALFEIGLEEMPARFIDDAVEQLKQKTTDWLNELRLNYRELEVFATPRRLVVKIYDLEEKQPDIEEEAKGPARKIAVDDTGNWTKAAEGFSRGQGKTTDDLYIKEVNGTDYIYINKFIAGEQTSKLLPSFKDVVLSLSFPKNMRWANRNLRYIRPIRWIVALYGPVIIPMEIEGVESSNESFGHRFLGEAVTIHNPNEYEDQMKSEFVLVHTKDRKEKIINEITELEQKNNWSIEMDAGLLSEVAHLVEYPTVFTGNFSEGFLEIPEEVLITSMKEHQRYFPVRSNTGELLPHFIGVRNGDENHIENVARGNEKVLKARLSDARFFYEEDQKQSIDDNVKKLDRMVFQEKIGTLAEKVKRVTKLTATIADQLEYDEETKENAIRASNISKFDLVTHMVNEFSELQGIMGEKYAVLAGEKEQVSRAIREHYLPRYAQDALPSTKEGSLVSVADKLDTIVSCISVGILPTGSQDPYALRRQAIGILQIIRLQDWDIDFESLVEAAYGICEAAAIPTKDRKETMKDLREFFNLRASYLLKDTGIEQDVIQAVLKNGIGYFPFSCEKASLLSEKKKEEAFKTKQEALVRVLNIADKGEPLEVEESLFENEYESELYTQYKRIKTSYQRMIADHKAEQALATLIELADPIHMYFDNTMVMVENERLRKNRLSLLNHIASLIYSFADLREVNWKQLNG